MPRTTLKPLASLEPLIPADRVSVSDDTEIALRAGVLELLLEQKLLCNGSCLEKVRDIQWVKDITQLVHRIQDHNIFEQTEAGVWVARSVKLDLLSLTCEVDDNGEICCWMYEEG